MEPQIELGELELTDRDWTNCLNGSVVDRSASIIYLISPGSSKIITIKVILIHNIYQSNYLVCDEYFGVIGPGLISMPPMTSRRAIIQTVRAEKIETDESGWCVVD